MEKSNPEVWDKVTEMALKDTFIYRNRGEVLPPYKNNSGNKLRGINIEKEYKLIQEKKSRLPKRLRDIVEALYNNQNKE